MIEKTRHPKPANDNAVDESTDDVKKLHDKRMGENAYCKNCVHAYRRQVTLKDTVLLCHAIPPDVAAQCLLDQQMNIINVQVSTHFIPRAVDPGYWCGMFKLDPDMLQS